MPDLPMLYGYGASTFTRMARFALKEKGVDHRFVSVASWDGYRKNPAFTDLHPFAKVPVLDHAGTRIYETLAICVYIDESFAGPQLQPPAPLERARMFQMMSVVASYAWPVWVPVLTTERFFAAFEGKSPDLDRIAAALPQIRHAAEVIDGLLALRSSRHFDLSDIFLAGSICYPAEAPEGRDVLRANPVLSDWWDRIKTRKAARDVMPSTDWSQRLHDHLLASASDSRPSRPP